CGGRLVILVEGGYDFASLEGCIAGAVSVLAGGAPIDASSSAAAPNVHVTDLIARLRTSHPMFRGAA
ncbi:MAG: hypothetical protein WC655_24215, partial [Candidatus Hydrogenedentales bacterium]